MYACDKCGRIFEDYPADGCSCGGEVTEAKRCLECGDLVSVNNIYDGYCKDCLDFYAESHDLLDKGYDYWDLALFFDGRSVPEDEGESADLLEEERKDNDDFLDYALFYKHETGEWPF